MGRPVLDNTSARRLFLHRHGLCQNAKSLADIFDRLTFVQVDSINTVARAHHMILHARQRVYAVREATPLERVDVGFDAEVWVKREDIPPIHAYKWRGAYNKMATLTDAQRARGVVCASAGNHAQGVAIAARELGCFATIFMPEPTPLMKRQAVALHGPQARVAGPQRAVERVEGEALQT